MLPGNSSCQLGQNCLSIQSLVVLLLIAVSSYTVWKTVKQGSSLESRVLLPLIKYRVDTQQDQGQVKQTQQHESCVLWAAVSGLMVAVWVPLSLRSVFGSLGGTRPFYPPRFIFLHGLINVHSDHTKESWNLTLPLFIFFLFLVIHSEWNGVLLKDMHFFKLCVSAF